MVPTLFSRAGLYCRKCGESRLRVAKRPRPCEFTGLRFRRRWTVGTENRHFSLAKVFAGKFLRSLDLGEEKATGGLKHRGHARSGTSRQGRYIPGHKRNPPAVPKT